GRWTGGRAPHPAPPRTRRTALQLLPAAGDPRPLAPGARRLAGCRRRLQARLEPHPEPAADELSRTPLLGAPLGYLEVLIRVLKALVVPWRPCPKTLLSARKPAFWWWMMSASSAKCWRTSWAWKATKYAPLRTALPRRESSIAASMTSSSPI